MNLADKQQQLKRALTEARDLAYEIDKGIKAGTRWPEDNEDTRWHRMMAKDEADTPDEARQREAKAEHQCFDAWLRELVTEVLKAADVYDMGGCELCMS
jgi:predicted Zn-dependent protease